MQPRKKRERERHRLEILEAAEGIFARSGYYHTTIEEIAKAADFAVGSLYNLFRSKEDLYHELIAMFAEQFLEEMEQRVVPLKDPEAALAEMTELRFEFLDRHSDFARVVMDSTSGCQPHPSQVLPARCRGFHERYISVLTDIFRRGVKQGVFDDFAPLDMALCFDGFIHAITTYWAQHDKSSASRARVHDLITERFRPRQITDNHQDHGRLKKKPSSSELKKNKLQN